MITENLGKLPPQAVELEEAVLGALMEQRDAYLQVSEFIKPEMFYDPRNQKIYNSISTLISENKPVDVLTVTSQLRKAVELEAIGGSYYLTELTNRVTSTANIEFHARIVYQKYLQREMIRISSDTIQAAYDDTTDVFDLHNQNQTEIFNLFSFTNGKSIDHISKLLAESIIELNQKPVDGLTGVGAGFAELDDLTGGWQKTDLIILAARPAMGKTALSLAIGRNAAVIFKKPTAIFSLEMSKRQLTNRLIASECQILSEDINRKRLSEYDKLRLTTSLNLLNAAPLHIDDTPALSLEVFRSKAIRLKKKFGIEFIVIDYLQLMTLMGQKKGLNREREISTISAGLKAIAKELDIPIMALSQLSRQVESRPGMAKRPMLSDLRESGSIEQDADQVYFLYRPEYYGITEDADGNSVVGLTEMICSKNRHGATDIIKLLFTPKYAKFSDWADEAFAPEGFKIQPSRSFSEPERREF